MVDAVSSVVLQGSRMLIIVPSVRAWRKIVMDVPKLSTLVLVEQTYSMSGVVSASRRGSLRHYSSSEILLYYVHAVQIPTKYDRYRSTTDTVVAINKRESCEALVMSWAIDGIS